MGARRRGSRGRRAGSTRMVAPLRGLRSRASRRMLLPALGAAATLLVGLVVVGLGAEFLVRRQDAPKCGPELSQQRSDGGESDQPGGAEYGGARSPSPLPRPPTTGSRPGALAAWSGRLLCTLETAADEIGDVSDGVIRATDAIGGIVVTSSVSSGDSGTAGATFSLRVPTRRLDDALARLSKLAHVLLAHPEQPGRDGGVRVGAGAPPTRRSPSARACSASSRGPTRQNETASTRERLRLVQSEIASARAQVRGLRTRTDFSAVSVTIEPGDGSGGGGGGGNGGAWTPGDALDDAVRVLEVFAGVALVGVAVLAPLALLGLAARLRRPWRAPPAARAGARGRLRPRRFRAAEFDLGRSAVAHSDHPARRTATLCQGCRAMGRQARVRVLVADDHPLYRDGIVRAIKQRPDLELVGEAGDGRAALASIQEIEPDVAVVDFNLPSLSGIQVVTALTDVGSPVQVLMLTAYTDSELVYDAIAAGARGYLLKDVDRRTICDAITAVARGNTVFSPGLHDGIAEQIRAHRHDPRPRLSPREREILTLAAEGRSGPEIARILFLSPSTVQLTSRTSTTSSTCSPTALRPWRRRCGRGCCSE